MYFLSVISAKHISPRALRAVDRRSWCGPALLTAERWFTDALDTTPTSVTKQTLIECVPSSEVLSDRAYCSSFRLKFRGAISRRLSNAASAAEIQAALTTIGDYPDDPVNVVVSPTTSPSGDVVAWRVTFLSHLEVRQPPVVVCMSLATVATRFSQGLVLRMLLNGVSMHFLRTNRDRFAECSRGRTFDGGEGVFHIARAELT